MAKRWLSCAEYHEHQQLALGAQAEIRHRRTYLAAPRPASNQRGSAEP
jgi:hypothetical protein